MRNMLFLHLSVYLVWLITSVHASHFRGGYISWQAVSPSITNGSTVTISIQQTYSWANTVVPCGQLIGDPSYLLCVSSSCSNYVNNVTVRGPCTSYDLGLDLSTAQSTTTLTLLAGSQLVLAFQSSNWLTLVYGVSFPPWSLSTYVNLVVRTDNGRINSAPTSGIAPLVSVLVSTQQMLRIPVADIDLDVVKCRWATNRSVIGSSVVDECGGVCQNMPNAYLYSTSNSDNNCTLVFNTTVVGYYVIALQIEDFLPSNPNGAALSSISLQFLVRAINIICNAPTIIGERINGATIQVQPNTTFTTSVIAQIGCNGSSIRSFTTIIIPSGMASTSTLITLSTSLYSVMFIWMPTVNQIGTTQLYCTIATADNNLQSAQYCLNFIVTVPTTTTTTSTSTTSVSTTTTSVSTTTSSASTTTTSVSTTSTTTSASTTTTSVTTTTVTKEITSTAVNNRTTDSSLILGLSLGLGLSLLLLATLLSCLCCCRYCTHPFWTRLRQTFLGEKNPFCSTCHGQKSTKIKPINSNIQQYRAQYIHEDSPFELSPPTATTTTFASESLNSLTPIEFASTGNSSPSSRLTAPLSPNDSILFQAFNRQEATRHGTFSRR